MQQVFVVLALVRESSVIDKYIVEPPAPLGFVRTRMGGPSLVGGKLEYVGGFKHGFLWHIKNDITRDCRC